MPSGFEDLRAYREYIVQSNNDEEIIRASSVWMVVDIVSRAPLRIANLGLRLPKNGKRNFLEMSRSPVLEGLEKINTLKAGYSSLDLNCHVNNTEYIRWVQDALSIHRKNNEMNHLKDFQAGFR